jgi:hypothetical protein
MCHPGIVMKSLVVLEWTVLDAKVAGVEEVLWQANVWVWTPWLLI